MSHDRHDEAKAIIATYHTNGDSDHPLVSLQMSQILATVDLDHQASWKDLLDLRVLVESRSSRYRLMLNIAFSWFGQFSGNKYVKGPVYWRFGCLTTSLALYPITCPSCSVALASQTPT
jgi:hypothetical protein